MKKEIKEIEFVFSCKLATYNEGVVLMRRDDIFQSFTQDLKTKLFTEAIVAEPVLEMRRRNEPRSS